MKLKSLTINLMTYGEFEGQYQGKIEFSVQDPKAMHREKQCHAMALSHESCNRIVALAADGLVEEAETLAKSMVRAVHEHNQALLARQSSERVAIQG